ncbi:MAG: winged helix-turn-helix transcriptional regulator [Candidatus Marinimicrobia bacterium]|nr:winged helix-turn-helix transcriptional regulator [Candidatus Neomarinimicrobiota bacterium]
MMKNIVTISKILKAISDFNRLRVCIILKERSMCLCEISSILDNIVLSTLSNHLKILSEAGIVVQKKYGRYIIFSLSEDEFINKLLDMIRIYLSDDERVLKDIEKVKSMRPVLDI